MKTNSKSKTLLALALAIALAATGCSAQWINTALQDLPVLTQMALNIATLVTTLAAGQQASTADTAVIQNISAQASRDLNLLQTLYSEYKASPSTTSLQKIQSVLADLNQSLPAMLQSAHISNATVSARVTAAVNLILTTVNSFAALMPQASPPLRARRRHRRFFTQRFEEAMEPAGLRAYRESCTGCGVRGDCIAIALSRRRSSVVGLRSSAFGPKHRGSLRYRSPEDRRPMAEDFLHNFTWSFHVSASHCRYQCLYLPV